MCCVCFPGVHCQNKYTRARPNDTDATDGEKVDFECHVANKAGSDDWAKEPFMLGECLIPIYFKHLTFISLR